MTFIPFIAFFVLIAAGLYLGELNGKRAAMFLALWVAGRAAIAFLGFPRGSIVALDALLDSALILMIFGGDIRIR